MNGSSIKVTHRREATVGESCYEGFRELTLELYSSHNEYRCEPLKSLQVLLKLGGTAGVYSRPFVGREFSIFIA